MPPVSLVDQMILLGFEEDDDREARVLDLMACAGLLECAAYLSREDPSVAERNGCLMDIQALEEEAYEIRGDARSLYAIIPNWDTSAWRKHTMRGMAKLAEASTLRTERDYIHTSLSVNRKRELTTSFLGAVSSAIDELRLAIQALTTDDDPGGKRRRAIRGIVTFATLHQADLAGPSGGFLVALHSRVLGRDDPPSVEALRLVCLLSTKFAKAASDEEADEIVARRVAGDPRVDQVVVARLHTVDLLKAEVGNDEGVADHVDHGRTLPGAGAPFPGAEAPPDDASRFRKRVREWFRGQRRHDALVRLYEDLTAGKYDTPRRPMVQLVTEQIRMCNNAARQRNRTGDLAAESMTRRATMKQETGQESDMRVRENLGAMWAWLEPLHDDLRKHAQALVRKFASLGWEADDLIGELALKLSRRKRADDFNALARQQFLCYCDRAMTNICLDRVRNQDRCNRYGGAGAESRDLDDKRIRDEWFEWIKSRPSSDEWEIIRLHYWGGLDVAPLATMMPKRVKWESLDDKKGFPFVNHRKAKAFLRQPVAGRGTARSTNCEVPIFDTDDCIIEGQETEHASRARVIQEKSIGLVTALN